MCNMLEIGSFWCHNQESNTNEHVVAILSAHETTREQSKHIQKVLEWNIQDDYQTIF